MEKNYAYQSGAFMALSKMMRDAVHELNSAKTDLDRRWAQDRLNMLAEQTTDTLVEFGFEQATVDAA